MSKLIKNEQVIMGTPSHMDATKVTYNHETVQDTLNRFGQDIWVNSQDIEELKKVPGVTIWDGLTEKKSFKQMMEEHFNKYGTGKDMVGFYYGGDREEQTYMPDMTSWMYFQFCIIGDQAKAIFQDYYTRKIYTLEGTINPDWIEHNIYYRQWEELAKTNGIMRVYDAQEAFFNHREDINGFTITDNCGAGRQYVIAFSELPGEPLLHLIKTTDGGQTWRSVRSALSDDILPVRFSLGENVETITQVPTRIYKMGKMVHITGYLVIKADLDSFVPIINILDSADKPTSNSVCTLSRKSTEGYTMPLIINGGGALYCDFPISAGSYLVQGTYFTA